jgi:E3 ubiquitin-protein ligase UBR7
VSDDIPECGNIYNQNYEGKFCHCGRVYNPTEETGNMLQCVLGDVCNEDWYHDYCIMGLPKFDPPTSEEEGVNVLDTLGEPGLDAQTTQLEKQDEDDADVAIDGFPRFEDFDCYICWMCISKHRDFFDKIKGDTNIVADVLQRIKAGDIKERNEKLKEQEGFFSGLKKRKVDYDYSLFLKEGHETHFKELYDTTEDGTIKKFLDDFFFLMKDVPIYEPPQDEDDDTSSIYDMGARAINSLPREQAIEGVQVFETIKTRLKDFLKPFAQDGKVVNKEDIESFFEELKKDKK